MEWVEVFKYLGRLILFVDDDTQAVRVNMKKARRCWARIIRGTYRELTIVIRRTGCSCRNGYWNESPIPSFIHILSLPPPALLLLLKHILHRPGPELHPLLSGATASGE